MSILKRKGKIGGFTLLELLVAFTIVAVLAVLLLAALPRAKASAKSAACQSNLRELGVALRLYVDNSEKYPLFWNVDTKKSWEQVLAPYCGGLHNSIYMLVPSPVFTCNKGAPYAYNWLGTSFGLGSAFGKEMVGDGFLGLGGSANNGMGRNPPDRLALPESRVLAPSDMIAIGDGLLIDIDLGVITGFGWPGARSALLHAWPNALFCDGHLESSHTRLTPTARDTRTWYPSFKPEEAFARRWNNDNRPHRETWPQP